MTEGSTSVAERRFVRHAGADRGFVSREVAGETIIVPVSGRVGDLEAIYTLNAVGSRIWRLLEAPITMDAMAETIAREFDVSADQAAADVAEFVNALETRGLVSTPDGPPDA